MYSFIWGYSSAGRAVALQAKGHRFDLVYLHQNLFPGSSAVEQLTVNPLVRGSTP